jgi:hypothetical protein
MLVLAATSLAAGATIVSDPQSLLAETQTAIERGDLPAAESAARALRSIIDSDPLWDPDGAFAATFLPEVEGRIQRLRDATAGLDLFANTIAIENGPPATPIDPDDVTSFLGWGDVQAQRIRHETDRIVATVAGGSDRGALLQTAEYRRAAALVETEVLRGVNRACSTTVTGLLDSDDRTRLLRNRLAALKREVMASSLERERLDEAIAESNERYRSYERALVEFIGWNADGEDEGYDGLSGLGIALAHRVRERLTEVETLKEQNWLEKAFSLEEIERFRLVNAISVSDGSRDLSRRIEALASAVETVPVVGGEGIDPSMDWLDCCVSACR